MKPLRSRRVVFSFLLVCSVTLAAGSVLPGVLSGILPATPATTEGPALAGRFTLTHARALVDRFTFAGSWPSLLVGTAVASELGTEAVAPGFSLRTLAGDRTVRSTELFAGRPFTLLVFWNSDCPDCVEALKQCQKLADVAGNKGVELVGINHDVQNIAAARGLLARQDVTFLQLWDPDRVVASSYGTDSYSLSFFLVDSHGVIHEAVYGRPPDVEGVLSTMLEKVGTVSVSDRAAPAVESPAAESSPRISVAGHVRIRAMNIRLSHDSSAPEPPSGPYGEVIRQGSSSAHRVQCELSGRITEALTAGALLRLSNEDESILVLGPQYLSRSEGSAYAQYRSGGLLVRVGYFDAHFTPLSLMRWDSEDNARTGGTASGCACAGATGAILLESLEELGPELTFEGLDVSHSAGELLDFRAFYARPRIANQISAGKFLADPEALSDFAYQRDLYGLRANLNVNHPALAGSALMSLHYVRTRDDEESATFVGSEYDPRGFASDNRVYGALVSVPLHDRLSLEVELERTETYDDVRRTIDTADWGNGLLGTLRGRIAGGVNASASYVSLSREFHSSYAALSYLPNRKGVRTSLSVRRGVFSCDLFAKFLEPYGAEDEYTPSSFPPASRAQSKNQLTLGAWASARLPRDLELGGGWLLERAIEDVYRPLPGPLPPPGYQHLEFQRRKNILTLQLVRTLATRSSAELIYQYVDYTDRVEPANDYSIHRTSLQFSIRF